MWPLKATEKSIYEYIRVYVVMLLFNIMYSYIISIFIIYLWYNYFCLLFRLLLKHQVFSKQAVPDRVAFRKHGIAIGIFSFFMCFSKIFVMVNKAAMIIGRTSAFLYQRFWISAISCVTSEFLFFNLVLWIRFVWLLYLFLAIFFLFYWHVCICIWSYSFLGLKFHSDLSPSVYVTGSGMWLFHLLLHSKWHLLHKFSEPFVLILPCL